MVVFGDVLVPWERVFVIDSLEMCQKQFHATPAHVYQNYQAQIRLSVKLAFLAGLARRITEAIGTTTGPASGEGTRLPSSAAIRNSPLKSASPSTVRSQRQ